MKRVDLYTAWMRHAEQELVNMLIAVIMSWGYASGYPGGCVHSVSQTLPVSFYRLLPPIQLFYNVRGYFWGLDDDQCSLSPFECDAEKTVFRVFFFFFGCSCSCVREKYLIGGGVIRWIHFTVSTLSRTSCRSCRTLLPQRCLYHGELFNWTESAWESAHNVLKQFVRTCHDAVHSEHDCANADCQDLEAHRSETLPALVRTIDSWNKNINATLLFLRLIFHKLKSFFKHFSFAKIHLTRFNIYDYD